MQREYQGVIFTTHALERAQKRSVSQYDVVQVIKYPEVTQKTEKPGSTKFIKEISGRNIHVVASHLKDKDQWLVVSVWVRGEDDQASFAWQLITFPFKVIWWLIKQLSKLLTKRT